MNKVTMRGGQGLGLQLLAVAYVLLAALGGAGVRAADVKKTPLVPALWVFGDSILDAGTNSLFNSLTQADFKPYGQQFFGKPTGRFTNGRVYGDLVAQYVGLPLVEPYIKKKNTSNTLRGLNYASAGAGILRETNAADVVIPYPDQILQFQQTRLRVAQKLRSAPAAKDLFSKSLFLVNIASNDIFGYVLGNVSISQDVFFDGLVTALNDSFKDLYDAGARKLVVLAQGTLGCVPAILALSGVTDGKCVESLNLLSQSWNVKLEALVLGLSSTFPGLRAIVGKPFDHFRDFIINPAKYGFTSTMTSCCGSGIYNAETQCGRPSNLITNAQYNLCKNVEEYVFWDNVHPTEKAYAIIAEQYMNGNTSSIAPVNLMTLAVMLGKGYWLFDTDNETTPFKFDLAS